MTTTRIELEWWTDDKVYSIHHDVEGDAEGIRVTLAAMGLPNRINVFDRSDTGASAHNSLSVPEIPPRKGCQP